MQVYEAGPLQGLPRRASHLRLVPTDPRREAIAALPADLKRAPAESRAVREEAWAYAGSDTLNDQLDIPGIPDAAPAPPVTVSEPAPFRSSTPVVVVLLACTLFYFAVRILGRAF